MEILLHVLSLDVLGFDLVWVDDAGDSDMEGDALVDLGHPKMRLRLNLPEPVYAA